MGVFGVKHGGGVMKNRRFLKIAVACAAILSSGACQSGNLNLMNMVPGARALPGGSIADLNLDQLNTDFRGSTRDQLVGRAIARSNKLCSDYIATVSATERGLNTGLGVFSTFAHMGGILADGTGAKAAWGAYGVAADGIQGNVRKGVFKDNEPTVLMAAIQKFRSEKYETLVENINDGGKWKDWSYELLMPALEEYHSSCTISNAIIEVQRSVSTPQTPK